MTHPPGYTVYRLEYKDGTVEIGLSLVHRSYLCFLAERGGETRFDYSKITADQKIHLRQLVHPHRCIAETAMVGERSDVVHHRLTDAGRNIVTAIREAGGP